MGASPDRPLLRGLIPAAEGSIVPPRLAPPLAEERIKPCLRCDGVFPFADSHCPSCGAYATPGISPAGEKGEETRRSARVPVLVEAALVGAGAALAVGTAVALGVGL